MNKLVLLVLVLVFCSGLIYAQNNNTSNIVINYTVQDVVNIKINEPSRDLDLRFGGVGSSIYEAREINATYNIAVNSTRPKRLMANINQNMPNNINLELRATPPQGSNSLGYVPLTTMPQTLVSGINNVNQNNLLLNFRLSATLGAPATPTPQTRIVTLTISD